MKTQSQLVLATAKDVKTYLEDLEGEVLAPSLEATTSASPASEMAPKPKTTSDPSPESAEPELALAAPAAPEEPGTDDWDLAPARIALNTPTPEAEDDRTSVLKLLQETFPNFFADRETALLAAAEKETEEEKVEVDRDLSITWHSPEGIRELRADSELPTWRVKDDMYGSLRAKWSLLGVPMIDAEHRIPVICRASGKGKVKTLTFIVY